MNFANWIAMLIHIIILAAGVLGLVTWIHRRFRISWLVFWYGGAAFLIAFIIPHYVIYEWRLLPVSAENPVGGMFAGTSLMVVSLLGVYYLSFHLMNRFSQTKIAERISLTRAWHQSQWQTLNGAVMSGIGFGAAQFGLLAVIVHTILPTLTAIFAPEAYADDGPPGIEGARMWLAKSWWEWVDVMGIVYNFLSLSYNIIWAILLILAVRKSWIFFPLAIVLRLALEFGIFMLGLAGINVGIFVPGIHLLLAIGLYLVIRRTGWLANEQSTSQTEQPSFGSSPTKA